MSQLAEVFSRWKIQESEYVVRAGFDESLIQSDVGYLEQIHVFTPATVHATNSQLHYELARIFSPFSPNLFTASDSHSIPVIKGDVTARQFDELVDMLASTGRYDVDKSCTTMPPTVISFPWPSAKVSFAWQFVAGKLRVRKHVKQKLTEMTDHNDENDEKNENEGNDENDENPDEDPEEPNTKVNGTTERAQISFNIVSNIQYDSEEANVFQSLTTEGSVVIQATPLNPQMPNEFAKCHLQFSKLRFSTKRTNDSMAYNQFHLRVVIDPQHENADIDEIKPEQTAAYERGVQESSATKTTHAIAGSVSASVGIKPQATLMASANRTSEVGSTFERKRYMSRITQQTILGVVWWGSNIDDPYEQEGGIKWGTKFSRLQTSSFWVTQMYQLLPPPRMELEVASYWSIMTNRSHTTSWIWRPLSTSSRTPSYSNICQIVALGVPTNLEKRSDYRGTIHVIPRCNKSQYSIDVNFQV
ncbi:hypothetical protein BYT27DRAFT_7077478 [Phlegmacium glaucopus]|nr:hypothetical protein BYT27DRAFT_7077478 [Phlegmacium glaucopus]